ncbi:hypothetical protein K458DRAFT_98398 [Lentithecium fluviatile CBS 122367]|uniref:Uncharacterized protein n=1 Tax=Lentithecium fluviatile CBS 122367 TaxID=1168545 RepID=A0A6G1JHZ7_9PLEO|nr:hypothetical protein K458DRAFT_98398 [Lentithecium fluviatile CBS 122367]
MLWRPPPFVWLSPGQLFLLTVKGNKPVVISRANSVGYSKDMDVHAEDGLNDSLNYQVLQLVDGFLQLTASTLEYHHGRRAWRQSFELILFRTCPILWAKSIPFWLQSASSPGP